MRQVLLITDASACLREGITTYAFWGKTPGFRFRASGLATQYGTTQGEVEAIVRGISVVAKSWPGSKVRIISDSRTGVEALQRGKVKAKSALRQMLDRYKEVRDRGELQITLEWATQEGGGATAISAAHGWCHHAAVAELQRQRLNNHMRHIFTRKNKLAGE